MSRMIYGFIAAAFVSTLALAQAMPDAADQGPGGGLMRADANHDGIISWPEAAAAATARFQALDTNHDGVLSADEMKAGPGAGRMTAGAGATTEAQYIERAKARFDRMDTDHDGQLDAAELRAVRERMQAMRGERVTN